MEGHIPCVDHQIQYLLSVVFCFIGFVLADSLVNQFEITHVSSHICGQDAALHPLLKQLPLLVR